MSALTLPDARPAPTVIATIPALQAQVAALERENRELRSRLALVCGPVGATTTSEQDGW